MLEEGRVDDYCKEKYTPYVHLPGKKNDLDLSQFADLLINNTNSSNSS